MVKTKKQIDASLARLDARELRLVKRIEELQRELSALNLKRSAVLKSKARLQKQLTTAREDVAKRTILEVTVAAKTRRSIIFAPFTHPDGRLRERWGVRCGYGVSSRYAVGDPIEIVFRYKKSIGGKGHWAHPTIVKLKPYRIEDMHTVTGYDS